MHLSEGQIEQFNVSREMDDNVISGEAEKLDVDDLRTVFPFSFDELRGSSGFILSDAKGDFIFYYIYLYKIILITF